MAPAQGAAIYRRKHPRTTRPHKRSEAAQPEALLADDADEMERAHEKESPGEPFEKPPLPMLAKVLKEAGYKTPRGTDHWWPAQVQQVLEGRFDGYYGTQNAELAPIC